ncbi:MAG: hypothetical protein RH942_12810 [Kiloniellaceae bacterium]
MPFAPRIGLMLLILSATSLAGCSAAPFAVEGSEAAVDAAKAEGQDTLPRLRPRAVGVCYSPAVNEPAEIEAEALYLCEGGRLVQQDEDFFWNGCSLSQPNRISYVCYPPDKARRLPAEETPPAN